MAKILCVDDDPAAVQLKQAILEKAGHTVSTASSAHEAMMKLENGEFDAVVTDWRLGDGDGRMVVQAAKAHARVPVIVVSGFIEDAYKAAKPQADLYLEKPADPKELLAILNALLKTPRKTGEPGV